MKSICFSFFWQRPLSLSLERPFALISCACHSFVVVGVDDALQLPLSIRERTVHSVRKICDLLVFRDVQWLKSDAKMARRLSEHYLMPKAELCSSDSSLSNDTGDFIYIRQNDAIQMPFRMNQFIPVETLPLPQLRPNSLANCKKCNQIRTNPRFRPTSFQSTMRSSFLSNDYNDESSEEDQVSFQKPSFPKNRRRFRHRDHAR